jgi:uncharacterized cupin superfamily protein
MANLNNPEWVKRTDAPLRGRTARVGALSGAERLGATLYEIDPGQNGSPFHLHHANEEMIIVLSGQPTLRTLGGSRTLEPGEVVACPVGRAGAHQLQNKTDAPVRALVISTMIYPETAEMLDSDKILVISHPPGTMSSVFCQTGSVSVPETTYLVVSLKNGAPGSSSADRFGQLWANIS